MKTHISDIPTGMAERALMALSSYFFHDQPTFYTEEGFDSESISIFSNDISESDEEQATAICFGVFHGMK